ncbi:hypothetical protein Agub_g6616, partial [Astrephomene gubernaculifera]
AAAAAATAGSSAVSSGSELPRRADIILHEIFGTDPLSEHILPSLAQVQEDLAAADAAYVPSAFRIVAALAHSAQLEARMRTVHPPLPLPLPREQQQQQQEGTA